VSSFPSFFERIDLALEAGTEYGTQLLDDTYSISVRRGVRSNGVTDDLEPATFTAVIKGVPSFDPYLDDPYSVSFDPRTNDDLRPERPIRLRGSIWGTDEWSTIWTGKIQRARLEHDPDEKIDPNAYRLHITGTDVIDSIAGKPSEVAVNGNLHQRVAAVMDPTGIDYAVEDPSAATSTAPLPTDAKDVLGQLRLIRDTAHALMYVNRDGVLTTVADASRSRSDVEPDWRATDDEFNEDHIFYTEIDPTFDTDAVVNLLTIRTLDGDTNPEVTYADEDSRDAWGDRPQTVTVNEGLAETHAGLYLASRVTPDMVPQNIAFVVQRRLRQANEMRGREPHLEAALGLELYDGVRLVRLQPDPFEPDIPDLDLLVCEITHTIRPQSWVIELGLRIPEVLATRWDDVPADLTWDDVPPTLTWEQAVNWHPYLSEGA
jgi:hypothetical protein